MSEGSTNFYVEVLENHIVEVRRCSDRTDCLKKLLEANIVECNGGLKLLPLTNVYGLALKVAFLQQQKQKIQALVYDQAMDKLRDRERLAYYNYDAVLGDEPLPASAKPLNLILSELPEDLQKKYIDKFFLNGLDPQRAHVTFMARWMLAVVACLCQAIEQCDGDAFEMLSSDEGVPTHFNYLAEMTVREDYIVKKMTKVLRKEDDEACFVLEVLLSATAKLVAVAVKPPEGSVQIAFCYRHCSVNDPTAPIADSNEDETDEETDEQDTVAVNLADATGAEEREGNMEIVLPEANEQVDSTLAPELSTIVFRSQEVIARKLLCETLRVLGCQDVNALSDAFDGFKYLIMVPKFNTLRQQTMDRVFKFEDLVNGQESSGWTVEKSVQLYPHGSKRNKLMDMAEVSREIMNNKRMLFVLVVDECHYAPTSTAIPLLQNEDLHKCDNFVVVLISATPYNCLSVNSRVNEENRIVWSKVLANERQASTYIGFEFYARSIAFRCPSDKCFIRIKGGNRNGHVDVDLPCLRNREFASYNTLLSLVAKAIKDSIAITLEHVEEENRCKLTFGVQKPLTAPVTVCGGQGILELIGFRGNIVRGVEKTIYTEEQISVDDGFPLDAQHYRSDKYFARVKKLLEGQYPVLKNANSRGKKKQSLPPSDSSKLLPWLADYRDKTVSTLGTKPLMKARNGFIIVLDYILSLAYFSVTRKSQSYSSDRQRAKKFIDTLAECCFYEDDHNRCDLLHLLDRVLKEMIKERKLELAKAGERKEDDLEVIDDIINEKRRVENEAAVVANQTWYTESDRIIKMLLEQKDPCPMVLLRVYDNDENLSMQRILRHALKVCFGNDFHRGPAFSVIGDVSNTNLYEAMEPYFKQHFSIQHELFGTQHSGSFAKLISLKSRLAKTKVELNYEDLAGLPCLIILCEKGRMGDTFPPQLRVLDLRMRTSHTGTTLIQELGRMCRYLKDSGEVVEEDSGGKLSIGNGLMVKHAESGDFLGVVETEKQWEYLKNLYQGKSLCYTKLQCPLPYALMTDEMMKVIRNGVDERETAIAELKSKLSDGMNFTGDNDDSKIESKRRQQVVLDHLRFTCLDGYLAQKKSQTATATFTLRQKGNGKHYDLGNRQGNFHGRRLLLSAECQIGKTGAYLSYLSHLAARLNFTDGLVAPSPPLIASTLTPQHFLYPYWYDMTSQSPLNYMKPHKGKYMRPLAKQRLFCALSSASPPSPNDGRPPRVKYQNSIERLEYPSSDVGKRLLDNLPDAFPILLESADGKDFEVDFKVLESYIDWDGRMRNGVDGNGEPVNFASEVIREMQENLRNYYELVKNLKAEEIGQMMNRVFWDVAYQENEDNDNDQNALTTSCGYYALSQATSPNDRNDCALSVLDLQGFNSSSIRNTIRPITVADQFQVQVSIPIFPEGGNGNPDFFRDWYISLDGGGNGGFDFRGWCQRNCHPKVIKGWIFTPSVIDKHGQRYKYLLRKKCFEPSILWQDYVQVLVVRSSQFTMYCDYYGGDYLIITLPDKMEVDQLLFRVEDGGVGFARRFIQVFAEWLGLNAIWMIDDNVRSCYQLYGDTVDEGAVFPQSQNPIKFGNIGFADVMIHIESIFYDGDQKDGLSRFVVPDFGKAPNETTLLRGREKLHEYGNLKGQNGRDYIGCQNHYGVIGIARELQYRNRRIVHPIKVTHSVYSFYLFNVAAARRHGLYYPPRKTMEDIEMNFMMEEKGLVVCKLQKFCHLKPVRSVRNTAQQQEAVLETLRVLQGYLGPASEGRYLVSLASRPEEDLLQTDRVPAGFQVIKNVIEDNYLPPSNCSSSSKTMAIVFLFPLWNLQLNYHFKDLRTSIVHQYNDFHSENMIYIFIVDRDEIDGCRFATGSLLRYDFQTIRCTFFTTLVSQSDSMPKDGDDKGMFRTPQQLPRVRCANVTTSSKRSADGRLKAEEGENQKRQKLMGDEIDEEDGMDTDVEQQQWATNSGPITSRAMHKEGETSSGNGNKPKSIKEEVPISMMHNEGEPSSGKGAEPRSIKEEVPQPITSVMHDFTQWWGKEQKSKPTFDDIRERVVSVMSDAGRPLSVDEIKKLLKDRGYQHKEDSLRDKILKRYSDFDCSESTGLWTLAMNDDEK